MSNPSSANERCCDRRARFCRWDTAHTNWPLSSRSQSRFSRSTRSIVRATAVTEPANVAAATWSPYRRRSRVIGPPTPGATMPVLAPVAPEPTWPASQHDDGRIRVIAAQVICRGQAGQPGPHHHIVGPEVADQRRPRIGRWCAGPPGRWLVAGGDGRSRHVVLSWFDDGGEGLARPQGPGVLGCVQITLVRRNSRQTAPTLGRP